MSGEPFPKPLQLKHRGLALRTAPTPLAAVNMSLDVRPEPEPNPRKLNTHGPQPDQLVLFDNDGEPEY